MAEAEAEDDEEVGSAGAGGDAAPSWLLRTRAVDPSSEATLSDEQRQGLSLQAAVAVLRARRPLATLRDVTGSLPSLARHLSRLSLSTHTALAAAIERLRPWLRSSAAALTVNGRAVDLSTEDAVQRVLWTMHDEGSIVSALRANGVPPRAASRLVQMPRPSPSRVDARRLDALWLSDVATDAPFKSWSTELSDAARPGMHGALRFTRHNLYTAVFALDPLTVAGALLGGHAAALCKKGAPLRIGLLPMADGGAAHSLGTRLAARVFADYGRAALLTMMRNLSSAAAAAAPTASAAVVAAAEAAEGDASRLLPGLSVQAVQDALVAAVREASGEGKAKAKGSKRKGKGNKKRTEGEPGGEAAAADAEATAVTAARRLYEEEAQRADGELTPEPGGADAWAAEARALGVPSDSATVLLNGLVIRGDVAAIRGALHDQVRRESRRLRPHLSAGGALLHAYSAAPSPPAPRLLLDATLANLADRGELVDAYSAEAERRHRVGLVADAIARDGHNEAADTPAAEDVAAVAAAALDVLEARVWSPSSMVPSTGSSVGFGGAAPTPQAEEAGARVALIPALANCTPACVELGGEGEGEGLHLVAVVEPLSVSAHRAASLLIAIRGATGARVTVLFSATARTPRPVPTDVFRSIALPHDPRRGLVPTATFELLRTPQQTLTLTPTVPPSWGLELMSSTDDLDNLQVAALPLGQPVAAAFTLSRLLLHGVCVDKGKKPAPGRQRGSGGSSLCAASTLRLHGAPLTGGGGGHRAAHVVSETTPLGEPALPTSKGETGRSYFQLHAPTPGLWRLSRTAADGGALAFAAAPPSSPKDAKPKPSATVAAMWVAAVRRAMTRQATPPATTRQPSRCQWLASAAPT